MKALFSICCTLLLLAACTQPIYMELDDSGGNAVVHGLLQPDSVAEIVVTQTRSYSDWLEDTLRLDFIEDLQPMLRWDGGEEVLTGSWGWSVGQEVWGEADSSWIFRYRGKTPLQAGVSYVLECEYEGKLLNAETRIPQTVSITDVEFSSELLSFSGGFTIEIEGLEASFQDVPGEENGYQVSYTTWKWRYQTVIDSILGRVIVDSQWVSVPNRYLLMFDQGIDGGNMQIRHPTFLYDRGNQPSDTIRVEVAVIVYCYDAAYRDFLQSTLNQLGQRNGSDIFNGPPTAALSGQLNWGNALEEPYLLQGNVNNAVGIFGSLHRSDTFWVEYEKIIE